MADWVWKRVYPLVLGFLDPSTPSMRKIDDGEKKRKKKKKEKRMSFLVATMSLPAVNRPNADARTTAAGTPHARAKMKL